MRSGALSNPESLFAYFSVSRVFYEVSFLFMSECFDLSFSSHRRAPSFEAL